MMKIRVREFGGALKSIVTGKISENYKQEIEIFERGE